MSNQIVTKLIAPSAVNGSKLRFRNDEMMRFRNAADSADINLVKLNASDQFILQRSFLPSFDDNLNIGSASLRFSNVFTVNVDAGASQLILKGSSISANSLQIKNIADPTQSQDAVSLSYFLNNVKIQFNKEAILLDATDISNQYVDLAHSVNVNSLIAFVNRLGLQGGGDDYSTSVVSNKTRITFLNSVATGGLEALAAGDILFFTYMLD